MISSLGIPIFNFMIFIIGRMIIILTFGLILTSDLLKDKWIDDFINNVFFSLSYKTSRFHVAVRLLSNRSENFKMWQEHQ